MAARDRRRGKGRGGKLARRTVTLGRARARSVPGALDAVEGFQSLLDDARAAPAIDPLQELSNLEALRGQTTAGLSQARQSTTGGLGGGGEIAALGATTEALSRGLLTAESRRLQGFNQRFQQTAGVLQGLGQLTQGGLRGGPAEAIVGAQAQIRAEEIRAAAMLEAARIGAKSDRFGDIVGGIGAGFNAAGAAI